MIAAGKQTQIHSVLSRSRFASTTLGFDGSPTDEHAERHEVPTLRDVHEEHLMPNQARNPRVRALSKQTMAVLREHI